MRTIFALLLTLFFVGPAIVRAAEPTPLKGVKLVVVEFGLFNDDERPILFEEAALFEKLQSQLAAEGITAIRHFPGSQFVTDAQLLVTGLAEDMSKAAPPGPLYAVQIRLSPHSPDEFPIFGM